MIYENLKGKRYIALVRCSSPHQADTSIPDQLRLLAAFAEENQMVRVDDVVLDGVTGSIPGARNDIAELIRRKEEKDDFDVLLVQDLSRFTRGGAEHGMKLEYDLLAVGVQVVFVSDNLPEGDHSGIIKSVGFYAAKQHAKAISFAAARGQMSALTQGRTVYCSAPPYAIDRLYVAANGRPLHIIRNLPDGTQHKLDPHSKAIMGTFRRNDGRGHSNHYRRQADEHVVLVPGADEQVETVRNIYRWSHVEGWGHWRIARELNARGVPSATGSGWSTSSVANILRNPIYTGYGIANRYTLAVYNMRSPNSPVPVKVDPRVLATRKMPQQRVRPRQQWFEQAYPMLADLLGPELKVLAVESHARRLNAMGAGRTPKFSTDRHGDSRYILKHILRSKQGGHAMTGRTLGPRGRRKRYYAIQRAYHVPQGDKTLRRLVPAEPIEQAVLTVVRDMLAAAPDLRDQVRHAVNRQLKTVAQDTAELTSLQRQRDELREQLEFVIDTLGTIGKEAARRKIEQLEAQLKGLNERIAKATSVGKIADADEQVEAIVARLAKLHDLMDGLPPAALRQLLSAMIYRLEVDLEMRTVELEVALLSWTDASKNTSSTLCLDGKRPWPLANEAQHGTVVLSVAFGCDWSGKRKCFECRRLQRAA